MRNLHGYSEKTVSAIDPLSVAFGKDTKRRDNFYITAEILEIAKEGTLKTQIMYRANLSFSQLNKYLDFMLKISFLEKIEVTDREIYRATDKGMDFLQRYNYILEFLRTGPWDKKIHPPLNIF